MASQYLRERRVPTVLGFDPMMQFIHEQDVSEAIGLALEHGLQGVFNVTGPGEVPLHTAIRETGGSAWSLPEPALRLVIRQLFRFGIVPFPAGAIDYLKYPVTVSGARFAEATHFKPLFSLEEVFESVRR